MNSLKDFSISPKILNHLMRKIGTSLFIMSFCLSSAALGMEDIKEEVTRHDVKMIVTKHLEKNPELMDASIGKDIVVFLGNTGAGKSTLINYLSEKELDVGQFKKIVLKNPNDPSALEIGGTKDSVTLLPRSVKVSNLLLYDLPGFGDTRGTAINLVNACFIKRIIENASSTKLVFVAGQDQITADRGKSFQGLLEITQKLLPEEQIVKFSSLIITKSDQDREDLVP
jgi:GTP-binding protein EngB required for normal cell division